MVDIVGEGIGGQANGVGVAQLVADLGNGPVSGKAAVSDEAQDIPADEPTGQSHGQFGGGAEGARSGRASGVGAMDESTTQFQGFLQGNRYGGYGGRRCASFGRRSGSSRARHPGPNAGRR